MEALKCSVLARKPPLLIVGDFLSNAIGIRFVCEDLAEGLAARGWQVTTTSSVEGRISRLLDMVVTTWLKRNKYAVAQVDAYSGLAFVWAEAVAASLSALNCPFVLTVHSGAFPEYAQRHPWRVRRLLSSASAVTSPSPFLQQALKPYRADIRVIPNGLHVSSYHGRLRSQVRPRLVWIRHFELRYNPVLAVEVLSRLAQKYSDATLLMAGPDRQDWSAVSTIEEARKRGVADRLHILGPVPKEDIPMVLDQGDIFLNTTYVDNTPVTVIEAMASGMCVISTNPGGVPFLVSDWHDALLVPCNDADAMAEAATQLVEDPTFAERLSRNALIRAQDFDWDEVLPKWEELLTGLTRSP